MDAVPEPVRAPRGTRQEAQLVVQPVDVRLTRWLLSPVLAERIGDRLRQVLDQIAHGPVRIG
jgi:hypothetical protein